MARVVAGAHLLGWFVDQVPKTTGESDQRLTVLTGFYEDSIRDWLLARAHVAQMTVYVDKRGLESKVEPDASVALYGVDHSPSKFHPKAYFVETEESAYLLVGSANFTHGGDENFEAGVYMEGEEARSGWAEIAASLGGLKLIVDLATLNNFVVARERMESASELWRHQVRAIAVFRDRKRGILEMATGTGKTRTAISILNRLFKDSEVLGAIIATIGNDLLDQWFTELCQLSNFVIWREYEAHHELANFRLNPTGTVLLVSREKLPLVLAECTSATIARHLLICDEVHSMGSPISRERLSGKLDLFSYRLGLTATSEREYDPEGNEFVATNIGPVIFQYGLEDAIRDGILCGLDYVPLGYEFSDEDRARTRAIYIRFEKSKSTESPMSEEELYLQLSLVAKLCKNKIPVFARLLRERPSLLENCIIYVETKEYGQAVQREIIHHQPNYRTYYAEDDVEALEAFRNREVACLLTCHKISAGIDVRHIRNIVLFSSARARLETIQRIGRCLRVDPSNPEKRALVVDFIRTDVGDEPSTDGVVHSDVIRRDWLASIASIRR